MGITRYPRQHHDLQQPREDIRQSPYPWYLGYDDGDSRGFGRKSITHVAVSRSPKPIAWNGRRGRIGKGLSRSEKFRKLRRRRCEMWVIETTFPFVYRNPTGGVINSVDMRLLHNTMALFIITLTMKTFSLAQARTQWFHILDLAQSGKRIKLVNDHTNRSYILELLPTESAKVMPAPNRTLFQRHS